jgi:uncharacterized 2Fe-2S/4Fe-4S cluster protein (DUF4445 family)
VDSVGHGRFRLCDGRAGRPDITLTAGDIRELQLAVGAIRAGVQILLSRASLAPADLRAVLVAGGFGSFIRRSNAQRIGLLPAGIPHERLHYIGNASLDGARWALLSAPVRAEAIALARRVEHVELSSDMQFQMVFAESMIFPAE